MAQFARPDADQATGSWTTTPLWSKVDEGSDGGDTITSDAVGNGVATTNADLRLSDVTDPAVSTGHIIRSRWASSSTRDITPTCELWLGIPGSGTLIATLTGATLLDTTEVTDTHTLTGTEADNITDYTDLFLRLVGTGSGGGPSRSLVVEFCELEVPDVSADFTADLSSASFATTAQNLDVQADYLAELSSASFATTAQDITVLADFDAALSSASFAMTAQNLDVQADFLAELSSALFGMTAQDVSIDQFTKPQVLNLQRTVDTGASSSVTHSSYVVPAGDNKILIAKTGNEFDGSYNAATSVKHNGVDFTKIIAGDTSGTWNNAAELWFLLLGSSTPSGDIVVEWGAENRFSDVAAYTVTNLRQQAPEASDSNGLTGTDITTTIDTITVNAFIADASVYGENNSITISQGPDQIEDFADSFAGNTGAYGMSHLFARGIDSYILGWTAVSQRWAEATAAFELEPVSFIADLTSASFGMVAQDLTIDADYLAELSSPSFAMIAQDIDVDAVAAFQADLTSASFAMVAQSLDVQSNYNADLTVGAFGMIAQDINIFGEVDFNADLTVASFGMTAQDLDLIADYTAALSTAMFSMTAYDLNVTTGEQFDLTSASFAMTPQDITLIAEYNVDLTTASFGMTAHNLNISGESFTMGMPVFGQQVFGAEVFGEEVFGG